MRLSPAYDKPAPFADPVHADDVGLVLDRPGLEQHLPVQPALLGPVGRHEVDVGGRRQLPELVGEAQVVADERADPQPVDLDGDELGRRRGTTSPRHRR